jgi:glycosyltransferase involved in cell wall biosynthesis
MKIIFAIPTFNRSEIVAQTLPQNISIAVKYGAQIVVVDNASTDSTMGVLLLYKDSIRILANEKNVGLKGSLRRIISEECKSEVLVIILSDEDVICEGGLRVLSKDKNHIKNRYSNSVLIFNCRNQSGRDYYPRRKERRISLWNDIEAFSFGLISGFGFFISSKTVTRINWDQINDNRNNYPHWGIMFDCGVNAHVVGIVISHLTVQASVTNLDQEWRSKKSHWACESVNDYLSYHAEHYKSRHASIFRVEYLCVSRIKEPRKSYFKKTAFILVLFAIAPRNWLYYFVRYLFAVNWVRVQPKTCCKNLNA